MPQAVLIRSSEDPDLKQLSVNNSSIATALLAAGLVSSCGQNRLSPDTLLEVQDQRFRAVVEAATTLLGSHISR
jgi:hypothetical protein